MMDVDRISIGNASGAAAPGGSVAGSTVGIVLGIAIWALHFGAIYAISALACARSSPGVIAWATGAVTIVAIGAALAIVVRAYPARARFSAWMSMSIAALALIAIVYEAFALLLVPACAP